VEAIGLAAVAQWAGYVLAFFSVAATIVIALILRTYDLQNMEALTPGRRDIVRGKVRRRAEALWAIVGLNAIGALSGLATILLAKLPEYGMPAGTFLVFSLFVAVLALIIVPSWYHEIESFKSGIHT
jgi:hypothetical protein